MTKKKKKNKVNKWLLVIMILLTGVMLTTSTYAWFTVNRLVQIESLNVKVEAQGGIDISTDATTWKSQISAEEIKNAGQNYGGNTNQIPYKMQPVSTSGNVTSGKIDMFLGSVTNNSDGNFILTAKKDVEVSGNEEGNFIAFDLFIRVNKDTELYLTSNSSSTYTGDSTPGIENATRFAFLILGNTPSGSSLGTIQGLNGNDGVYIWEPNYDVHSESAIRNAYDVYGITVGSTSSPQIKYDGIISEINTNDNILVGQAISGKYPDKFKSVNIDYLTSSNFNNNVKIFSIKNGITKIRIYIWIEGQDIDCENNSSVGNIDFRFEFSSNPS